MKFVFDRPSIYDRKSYLEIDGFNKITSRNNSIGVYKNKLKKTSNNNKKYELELRGFGLRNEVFVANIILDPNAKMHSPYLTRHSRSRNDFD